MSQLVKHLKVSAIADGPDPNQVNPSDWNASHVFSGGALGGLLMRDTGDATYGASWLASVAAGNVLISNGVGAMPTWAASLTLGGTLTVNGSVLLAATLAGDVPLSLRNSSAAAVATVSIFLGNDLGASRCQLVHSSSTYTSSGPYRADQTLLLTSGAGGCAFYMNNTTAGYDWWTAGVQRLRLAPTGELLINTITNPNAGILCIFNDATVHPNVIVLQNTNATLTNYLAFINSAGGVAGLITQTGPTTVAYQTSSDARLKDDAGAATDVSALRAVVVHDFTWKADGVRDRGVFAQEAYDVFPLAVSKGTDERTAHGDLTHPWMTDYSKFVPDLIVGWQQLDAEVAALRATLATLRS